MVSAYNPYIQYDGLTYSLTYKAAPIITQSRNRNMLSKTYEFELSKAASQAAAYFPQRICVGHVVEEHGDQLGPTGKSFSPALSLVFSDKLGKFSTWKVMK